MDELKWDFEDFYDHNPQERRWKADIIASYGEGEALGDSTLWAGEIVDEVQPDLRALAALKQMNESSENSEPEAFVVPTFEEVIYGGHDDLTITSTAEDVVDGETLVLGGVRDTVPRKKMRRIGQPTEYIKQEFTDYQTGCDSDKPISELIESQPIRKVWVTARRRKELGPSGLPLFLDAMLHGTAKKHVEETADYCKLAGLSYTSSKEQLALEIEKVEEDCRKLIYDAMWKLTQLSELARTHDHLVNEM